MKNVRASKKLSLVVKPIFLAAVVMGLVFLFQLPVTSGQDTEQQVEKESDSSGNEHRISGPYAYKNLSVYLIHAEAGDGTAKFMTLEEALEQKKAAVSETGTVNTLIIENVSDDVYVYIQAGDIVRGGKQDRTLGCDYVVPPESGKIPISSFCVERGRWQKRGSEKANEFTVSGNALPSKGLKLAANYSRSQHRVWSEVETIQNKLSSNLGKSVRSNQSASSLELTLDNTDVKKAIQEYLDALGHIIDNKEDVIGFAYAVNGKVEGADLYSSSGLFRKLWSKLLEAASVEAVAEIGQTEEFTAPGLQSVYAFLKLERNCKVSDKQASGQIKIVTRQCKEKIAFETYQAGQEKALHKSYIRVTPDLLEQHDRPGQDLQIQENMPVLNNIQQQIEPRRSGTQQQ